MAIVRFNRKFTESELRTAWTGAATSISSTAIVDGTWYIPKYVTGANPSTPNALYVGVATSANTAVLKRVADLTEGVMTGEGITDLINNYISTSGASAHLISNVTSATNDGSGNPITSTYVKVDGTNVMTAPLTVGESGDYQANYGPNSIVNEQGREILDWDSSGHVNIASGSNIEEVQILNVITIDSTGLISGVATPSDSTDAANKHYVDTVVSSTVSGLDSTVSKSASSSASAIANTTDLTNATNAAIAVATGYSVVQTDGKLSNSSSSITSGRADKWGAAAAALKQAKDYADSTFLPLSGGTMTGDINMDGNKITDLATPTDSLDAANKAYVDEKISNLGAIMTFKGTQQTESALKTNVTTPHKADVWVVTADGSEWVYTGDTVDASHAYDSTKWEKFGTTDVQGALFKTTDPDEEGYHYAGGEILISEGTTGRVRTIAPAYQDEGTFEPGASGTEVVTGISISGSDTNELSIYRSTIYRADSTTTGLVQIGDGIAVDSSGVISANEQVDGVNPSNGVINAYCSCTTGASTAAKTANITSGSLPNPLVTGTRVQVKFANANTAAQPTLNISSSGALGVYVQGTLVNSSNGGSSLLAGVQEFVYDGTGWCLVGGQRTSGSVGTTSSAADAWKTVVHDASLSKEGVLSGNTKSIPEALPVGSSGATSGQDGYMTAAQATAVKNSTSTVDGVSAASNVINAYGTCSTAASTAAKTATLTSGNLGTTAGTRVAIKFANANTASNPTLNVSGSTTGSTGAKNIFVNGTQITTGSNKGMLKGVCIFIYDGTQWHLIGGGSEYTAGDGLGLTDKEFYVNVGTGLSIDPDTGELIIYKGTDNWNEDTPDLGSWKTPYVRASIDDGRATGELSFNDDAGLYIQGYYQSIPAAAATVGATTGNDGYMTVTQATNLAIAMGALQWEE